MLIWIVAAVAAGSGQPWTIVAGIVVFAVHPVAGTVVVIVAAVSSMVIARRRKVRVLDEAAWLRRVLATVSAGSTLRHALVVSGGQMAGSEVESLCRAGAGMDAVGAAAAKHLPISGTRFGALCSMSEFSGSSVAAALRSCIAAVEATVQRQRAHRTAMAQIRFSAWVVGLGPLVLTVGMVGVRGIPEPGGAIVVVPMLIGFIMQMFGLLVVFHVSNRVTR